jgi:CSLREA domain-containing protein
MTATRRLSAVAALLAAGMLLAAQPAAANLITPNTLTDEYNSDVSTCSLREAVQSANTDTAFNGCTSGSGPDQIDLGDGTYQLSRAPATSTNADGNLDVVSGSTVTISHTGSGRTAIDGGDVDSVILNDGDLTITGIAIQNGSRTGNGGGIFTEGTLTMTNAAVIDNEITTGYAGAISVFSGTTTLTNSTFSGNRAATVTGPGAGAFYVGGTLNLTNVTISGNNGNAGFGGGVDLGGTGTMNMKNTIIAGNTASGGGPDCYHPGGTTLNSLGYNLIGDSSSCSFTLGAGDQIDVSAGLAALADNGGPSSTQALLPGSNALDKVPPASCTPLTTDQRGYPRPSANNANCDVGAYELTSCDGNPLNAPGAFPGCPPPPPAAPSTGASPQPLAPLAAPPRRKKCRKKKRSHPAAVVAKCKKKK